MILSFFFFASTEVYTPTLSNLPLLLATSFILASKHARSFVICTTVQTSRHFKIAGCSHESRCFFSHPGRQRIRVLSLSLQSLICRSPLVIFTKTLVTKQRRQPGGIKRTLLYLAQALYPRTYDILVLEPFSLPAILPLPPLDPDPIHQPPQYRDPPSFTPQ